MMNTLKQFILTALLSAATGMLVGLPVILHEHAPVAVNLFKSGTAGCLIGIAAFLVISIIFRTIHSHPFHAFFTVILIIGFGTLLGGYLSGIDKIRHFIAVISGAEVVGIILTYFLYRYINKLNNKLEAAKEKLRLK